MKKIFLLALALFSASISSQACDGSCTMGGSYLGILPQFHKNFVGLRYTSRSYTISTTHTHLHEGMPMTHDDIIEERYNTMEVWGRFVPVKNVQLFAFLPYAFNQQHTSRGDSHYRGLGDVTLLANYSLLNTGDSAAHTFKHTLQVGGGVKLATGRYAASPSDHTQSVNLQPGSGSTDYLLNGIYTLRYGKVGLNTDFTYRFNTANSDGYKFGDRLSASSNLFYWHNLENVLTLLPSAGLYYEHAEADHLGSGHDMQGGDSYYANLGLNMYIQKIAVGGTLQLPISSKDAQHVTEGNTRALVNLSYLF
ncbi:hypothetical protein CLV24_14114 [Pontibacter ummariensis]|uniref:MetA-pathway of phenol degradation n=1 Tax=Pontibacter ummariensis TaxID=1610492 RepID=A0A239LH78_9BACT|nr:hypothetical protein [Pontibacter ummariensis]PRY03382.1 hypothetical protein CLV24_14114 [Pontibacter ummariensis]SNT29238.1 hypothetical protein SAMN06296052_14112 [Pontibacter ummariensis]